MQKYTDQNKATSEAAHVSNHLQIPVQVSDINTVVLMLRHRRFIFLNLFFLNSSNLVLPALINNLADFSFTVGCTDLEILAVTTVYLCELTKAVFNVCFALFGA